MLGSDVDRDLRSRSRLADTVQAGIPIAGQEGNLVTTETDLTWRTCPVCGYLVPAQQSTCKKCASLAAPPPIPPPMGPSSIDPQPSGSEFLPSGGVWTPRQKERRPLWILGGAIVAVVALLAGLVSAGVFDPRSSYPSKWDARLGALPATVERLRGLKFVHAVPVRFLSEADFKKEVGLNPKPGAKQKKAMQRFTEQLRAGGLIAGKVDLLEAVNAEQRSSVLAFYSPNRKEVVVRGLGTPDAAHRVTLAHELTHVLQDQHFDINRLEAKVRRDPEGDSDALRAFLEGDANRIEDDYVKQLSAADRAAYQKERDKEASKADQGTQSVPAIVTLEFSAPYRYGPPVLKVLAAAGGNGNVDRAFRRGVFTQKLFIEPSAPLSESTPLKVATPKLKSGEKAVGKPDGYGAFDLYLLLGSRIDPGSALGAAVDWAGGRARTFRTDGRLCMRSVVQAKTARGNNALALNFRRWAAALPPGMAEVGRRGDAILVTSCDPGAKSALSSPDAAIVEAGAMLDLHGEIEASLMKEVTKAGGPASAARCFALEIARSPQIAILLAQPESAITPKMAQDAVEVAGTNARSKCLS